MKKAQGYNIVATSFILVACAFAFSRPLSCGQSFFTPPVYDPSAPLLINARPIHPTGLATDSLTQKGRKILRDGCDQETVIKVLGEPLVRWRAGRVLVYATAGVSYDWREGDMEASPAQYLVIELDSQSRVYSFVARSAATLPLYYPNEKLPPTGSPSPNTAK